MTIKYIFKKHLKENVLLYKHEVLCIARIISHKLKCTHPQAIQDVDEFVSSLEQKYFLCSEWVPPEWESKERKKSQ